MATVTRSVCSHPAGFHVDMQYDDVTLVVASFIVYNVNNSQGVLTVYKPDGSTIVRPLVQTTAAGITVPAPNGMTLVATTDKFGHPGPPENPPGWMIGVDITG